MSLAPFRSIRFKFVKNSEYLHVGMRFLLREGKTKVRLQRPCICLSGQAIDRQLSFPRRLSGLSRVCCPTTAGTILTRPRLDKHLFDPSTLWPTPSAVVVQAFSLFFFSLFFVVRESCPAHYLLVLPVSAFAAIYQHCYKALPTRPGFSRKGSATRTSSRLRAVRFSPFLSLERAMSSISTAQASKSFLSQCDDLLT